MPGSGMKRRAGSATAEASAEEKVVAGDVGGSEVTPRRKKSEKKLADKSGEKTPQAKSSEKEPHAKSGEETPRAKSSVKTPQAKSGEKTPQAKSGEKTPQAKSGKKTPRAKSGVKTPQTKSAKKVPLVDKVGGDEGDIRPVEAVEKSKLTRKEKKRETIATAAGDGGEVVAGVEVVAGAEDTRVKDKALKSAEKKTRKERAAAQTDEEATPGKTEKKSRRAKKLDVMEVDGVAPGQGEAVAVENKKLSKSERKAAAITAAGGGGDAVGNKVDALDARMREKAVRSAEKKSRKERKAETVVGTVGQITPGKVEGSRSAKKLAKASGVDAMEVDGNVSGKEKKTRSASKRRSGKRDRGEALGKDEMKADEGAPKKKEKKAGSAKTSRWGKREDDNVAGPGEDETEVDGEPKKGRNAKKLKKGKGPSAEKAPLDEPPASVGSEKKSRSANNTAAILSSEKQSRSKKSAADAPASSEVVLSSKDAQPEKAKEVKKVKAVKDANEVASEVKVVEEVKVPKHPKNPREKNPRPKKVKVVVALPRELEEKAAEKKAASEKKRRAKRESEGGAPSAKRARLEEPVIEEVLLTTHVLNVAPWVVSPIMCVAASPKGSVVATARANGDVEVRGRVGLGAMAFGVLQSGGQVMKGKAGTIRAGSGAASCMAFSCEEILVVGRIDGVLEIVKVMEGWYLEVVARIVLPGGAVWAVDVRNERIAVACNDGFVRVVKARDGGWPVGEMEYDIAALRAGGKRVLSVRWIDDETLVVGDARGGVRWLKISGGVVGKGLLGGSDVKVWCLVVVKEGKEVISGDSTGRLGVWDVATGTLMEQINIEGIAGDVLAAVLAPKGGRGGGEMVLVSSADGCVGALVAAPGARPGDAWTTVRAHRLHDHDIRGLTVLKGRSGKAGAGKPSFVTGSLDGVMCVVPLADVLKGRPSIVRLHPFASPAQQAPVQFIPTKNIIICRGKTHVDIWRVYEGKSPSKLLRLSLESLGPILNSVAVSTALDVLVVTTPDVVRMYHIDHIENGACGDEEVEFTATITPVAHVAELVRRSGVEIGEAELALRNAGADVFSALAGSLDVAFIGPEQDVIAVAGDGQTLVLCQGVGSGKSVGEEGTIIPVVHRFSKAALGCADGTHRLGRVVTSSADHRRCAVSDSSGRIVVLDLSSDRSLSLQKVFSHSVRGSLMCMAFSADGSRLAVSGSDALTVVFDLESSAMYRTRIKLHHAHTSTCLSFSRDNKALVASGPHHCVIARIGLMTTQNFEKVKADKTLSRMDASDLRSELESAEGGAHQILAGDENTLGSAVLGNGHLLVMKKPWEMVLPDLPKALDRKIFGR